MYDYRENVYEKVLGYFQSISCSNLINKLLLFYDIILHFTVNMPLSKRRVQLAKARQKLSVKEPNGHLQGLNQTETRPSHRNRKIPTAQRNCFRVLVVQKSYSRVLISRNARASIRSTGNTRAAMRQTVMSLIVMIALTSVALMSLEKTNLTTRCLMVRCRTILSQN